jgi:hypothetical protein
MLFGWCYYSKDGSAPGYEYVKDSSKFFLSQLKDKDKSDKELKWDSILRSYNYTSTDEFDLSLASVVETGYVDEGNLLEKAKKANDEIIANKSHYSFSSAWSLFHDTFENNEEELINTLTESFSQNARYSSPLDLNSTVGLLRELGKNDLANDIIEIYVKTNEDKNELFDLDRSTILGKITDRKLIQRFNQKYNEVKK